jgi:hypothetical protein
MINIEKAFVTENRSVYDFFQQPGMGFYIPLYQREYSWDTDNIEQLLEDISRGIERVMEDDVDEIRFLGTIITVAENNKNNVQPQDTQALPSRIEKLIDGQQRLSTIAVFATLLHQYISEIEKKIKNFGDIDVELVETCQNWKDKLVVLFSLDLGRGNPRRKPKIIRGQRDKWIREGEIKDSYTSPIANYLAAFLDHIYLNKDLRKPNKDDSGQNFVQNIKAIESWIKNKVMVAHLRLSDDFLPAIKIVEKVNEENIWFYPRPNLIKLIQEFDSDQHNRKSANYVVCELAQVFSVCHYLLERCCFTIIQPSNDDWAFDMFQSLNATGTPLTAIETFKPLVVNTTEMIEKSFKGSENEKSFNKIEALFKQVSSSAQKSKLTNDFLTSFAIAYDGFKLSSHFSHQRKQLEKYFNECGTYREKSEFVKFLGDYAECYSACWSDLDLQITRGIPLITSAEKESELAAVLVSYLKDSNHKMALTILGHFYKDVINGEHDSISNFISAVKCIAAFYTIWRSAKSNAGLDSVYRDFFKGEENSWKNRRHITIPSLKKHFINALKDPKDPLKDLSNFETWFENALIQLTYQNSKYVSRLALFIAAHDTIPDEKELGLMKIGVTNSSNHLCLDKWLSPDLKTLEHVAPQTNSPDDQWDLELYTLPNEVHQMIGNLTLLPSQINTSASNKSWRMKYIYYRHLSEKDPIKLQELANLAKSLDIQLSQETIKMLREANFNDHISSVTARPHDQPWNAAFVRQRSERIIEILWKRTNGWLFN